MSIFAAKHAYSDKMHSALSTVWSLRKLFPQQCRKNVKFLRLCSHWRPKFRDRQPLLSKLCVGWSCIQVTPADQWASKQRTVKWRGERFSSLSPPETADSPLIVVPPLPLSPIPSRRYSVRLPPAPNSQNTSHFFLQCELHYM